MSKIFLAKFFVVLFIINSTITIFEQWVGLKMSQHSTSPHLNQNFLMSIIIIAIGVFLFKWLKDIGVLYLFKIESKTTFKDLRTSTLDYLREDLKAIGNLSLWSFVFIIPGLLRWIDYSLLGFVVFFNPRYQNGDEEALSLCRRIAKTQKIKLISLWFVLQVFLQIVFSIYFSELESFIETPIAAIFTTSIYTTIDLLWLGSLYKIYHDSQELAPLSVYG